MQSNLYVRMTIAAITVVMMACGICTSPAIAQPATKTIRVIVPYGAGGATDFIARQLAERLSARLNRNVIVENRPGADGVVGTATAARAAPDGSTYVMVVGTHLLNPLFHDKLPYDSFKDFSGVTMIARSPVVFVARSDFPAKDIREFVQVVRKNPGKYSLGNAEKFTMLVAHQLSSEAGLDVVHAPYNGAGPMLVDVAGGSVTAAPAAIAAAASYLQSGRLRPLGVTGLERTPVLPDVPTLKELGLGDFNLYITYSMYAPAGTPLQDRVTMQQAIKESVETPEMKAILSKQALTPVADTVEDFEAQQKQNFSELQSLKKKLGL